MPDDQKKWGIMVYMAADNDLTEEAIRAIGQIRQSFERNGENLKNVEFFLYFDGNAYGYPSLQFDFGARMSDKNPIVFNREYRSSPDSIYRFVERCASEKQDFKDIDHYALIVSSHGYGFQEDSLLKDEASRTSSTVQKLAWNIAGLNYKFLGGRLGILGFDSCVMNSLEVAHQLSQELVERATEFDTQPDLTGVFLVSSEGYVPKAGWNYSRIVNELALKGDLGPHEMARLLVDGYIDEYKPNLEYSGLSLDIASFSLAAVCELVPRVFRLGRFLRDQLVAGSDPQRLSNILLSVHSTCQTYLYDQCVDLKDFCDLLLKQLSGEQVVREDSDEYDNLVGISNIFVSDAVYCKSLGTEAKYSNGMSLYFPWSYDTFLIILSRYRGLKFGQDPDNVNKLSGWGEFLWYYLLGTIRDDQSYRNGTRLFELASTNGLSKLPLGVPERDEALTEITEAHLKVTNFFGVFSSVKVNPPDNVKVNPPDHVRINPPDKTRLTSLFIENFRRTRNVRWMPEPARRRLVANLDENGESMEGRRGRHRERIRKLE